MQNRDTKHGGSVGTVILGKHPFLIEPNVIYAALNAETQELCHSLRDVPTFFEIGIIRTTSFHAKL